MFLAISCNFNHFIFNSVFWKNTWIISNFWNIFFCPILFGSKIKMENFKVKREKYGWGYCPHSWWKIVLAWHCSTWLDMIAFDRSKLIVWERWRGFYPITLGKEQQTPLYQMPWWDQETAKNWSFPICEIIYCFSHYEAAHWSGVFLYKSKLIVARSQIIAKKDKKQPVKYFHYY